MSMRTSSSDAATEEAARAFEADWRQREEFLKNSPITRYLHAHDIAGSPGELTIMGVAGIRVTLNDLKALVRALK
jgi:hypothetical protein